jgi:hypothetical protein
MEEVAVFGFESHTLRHSVPNTVTAIDDGAA